MPIATCDPLTPLPTRRRAWPEGRLRALFIILSLLPLLLLVTLLAARFASGRTGDFRHFYDAAVAMRHGQDIYRSGTGGYIYPPFIAFLFQPLALLSQPHAALIWLLINATLAGLATYAAAAEILRRLNPRLLAQAPWSVWAVVAATSWLSLPRLRAEFLLGQTDMIMLLAFALALRWLDRRPLLAALTFGATANIKYLPLIVAPYQALRLRLAAAFLTVLSFALLLLLPAASVGWNRNLQYLGTAFGGMGRMLGLSPANTPAANIFGVGWERSVSLTSAFFRLTPALAVPLTLLAPLLTLAVLALLYRSSGFALFRLAKNSITPARSQLVVVEWAGLIVAALVFSPQTTLRHMVLTLLFVCYALTLVPTVRRPSQRWTLAFALAVVIAALNLPPGNSGRPIAMWRFFAGPSWCVLLAYLLVARVALSHARTVESLAETAPQATAGNHG